MSLLLLPRAYPLELHFDLLVYRVTFGCSCSICKVEAMSFAGSHISTTITEQNEISLFSIYVSSLLIFNHSSPFIFRCLIMELEQHEHKTGEQCHCSWLYSSLQNACRFEHHSFISVHLTTHTQKYQT